MIGKRIPLWSLLFTSLFLLHCAQEEKILGPSDEPDKYSIYKSLTASRYQLFTQGDTCRIELKVVNSSNSPVEGLGVNFSAEMGSITVVDTTDSKGIGSALYTSGDIPGIDKITVNTGIKEDSLFLLIVDRSVSVTLTSDTTTILADGVSSIQVKASVRNDLDEPAPSTKVYFKTTAGQITSEGTTNVNGITVATLTSVASGANLQALVIASLEPLGQRFRVAPLQEEQDVIVGKHSKRESIKLRPVKGISNPGKRLSRKTDPVSISRSRAAAETITNLQGDSLIILFKGITAELRANRAVLIANGEDVAEIRVSVFETTTSSLLPNIPFTAATNRGTIAGDTQTGPNGQAMIQLYAGTQVGTASVSVTVGTGVSTSLQIPFISAFPSGFALVPDLVDVLADGETFTLFTAAVTDTFGKPLSGANVIFQTGAGLLSDSAVITDSEGQVEVDLSSPASDTDVSTWLQASVLGYTHLTDSSKIDFRGISIQSFAESETLFADGLSSTQITAMITESVSNIAIVNRNVFFSTTHGSVNSPAMTDSSGRATTQLTAGSIAGTAKVMVTFGSELKDSLTVDILSLDPDRLILSGSVKDILGDGVSTADIEARVIDVVGNPVAGVEVVFSTDRGSLSDTLDITDSEGLAAITFTSLATAVDRNAQILARVSDFPAISAGLSVKMRGLDIEISAEPTTLVADNASEATINVTVLETTSNNVVPNMPVAFAASSGTITGGGVTDENGSVSGTLTSGSAAGNDTVTVSVGSTLTESMIVTILEHDADRITVSGDGNSILADGSENVEITATVFDPLNNPVAGQVLRFFTNKGTLSDSLGTTDTSGEATVFLVSLASTMDQESRTWVTVTDNSTVTDSIDISFRGVQLNLSANPTQILSNGTSNSTITAVFQETVSGNPISSKALIFSTSRGSIPASAITNTLGVATTTLTSGTAPGTADIIGAAGVSDTISVTFVSTAATKVTLTADASSILADGESTTDVTAIVEDALSLPVSNATINFTSSVGTVAGSAITDADGEAIATLTSIASTTDQTANFKATVSGNPTVLDSIDITFRGVNFTVAALDTWLIADGSSTAQISAQLQEQNSGNPLEGKTIYWSATSELATIPESSTTNSMGQATTTLSAKTTPGTAKVTATFGSFLTSVDSITLVAPSDSTLILSKGSTPTDNGNGTKSLTIAVLFNNATGNPVSSATIDFSLTPNTLGTIISPQTTDSEGLATTTLTYSFVGESLRVWAKNGNTIGYLDVILE